MLALLPAQTFDSSTHVPQVAATCVPPLQVQDASKGMAGSQSDPASLLRVLIRHGRIEQAAALALQYLRAWQTQVQVLASPSYCQ